MRRIVPIFLMLAAAPAWAGEGHMHQHDDAAMSGHMHEAAFSFGKPGKPEQAARAVQVVMGDMSFTPASVSVKAGETVRFDVRNDSSVDHDFTLGDEATQQAHRQAMAAGHSHGNADANAVMVPAGKSSSLVWTFTKPGALAFDCNVPGHFESGMAGTIQVLPAK